MSRQEAAEQYAIALKAGQKCRKECLIQGKYPYPQVLDEIFDESMAAGRVELGTINIPTEHIVGTKTGGRQNAFAANFMPLLGEETEFAHKWISLCETNLSDEGIRDPIRCCEYMGRFYVQEGNKRVSVLKSFGAPSIPAVVTRIIPAWSQEHEVRLCCYGHIHGKGCAAAFNGWRGGTEYKLVSADWVDFTPVKIIE